MELYIEKQTSGVYGLVDTFINESISLNTKTLYTQDITAVFKGFTNSFSVQASPNNVKLLGYFGFTEQLQPTSVTKKAKLFLDGILFKEGIITLENTSWINSTPSLFQLSFSDGQKNLTEILGEDTLAMLDGGDLLWTNKNIQNALQTVQSTSDGFRWFIPLVSTERIFSIDSNSESPQTDNIFYTASKNISSENILLEQEIRPAMFMTEILKAVNKKYDIKIDPTPYVNDISQLTDLCTMCTAKPSIKEVKAKISSSVWSKDYFREERFDIILKPLISGFELNYLGYGSGSKHDATFGMTIQLYKNTNKDLAIAKYIYGLEVWEVFANGDKKKKLNYAVTNGSEQGSAFLSLNIGLDVFYPTGTTEPSVLVKPLISIFVSSNLLSEWKFTNVSFNWATRDWYKEIVNNVQPIASPTTVNLFKSLPNMKIIDFVKSIYTMFGYKKFKNEVLNDFYYKQKTIFEIPHKGIRVENDLTPYADLSKLTKKTNSKYDGYDLKHFSSEYQQNKAFLLSQGMEWGQLKYSPIDPTTLKPIKPKTEFKIETNFTTPVFNPILSNADNVVNTFYPFGTDAKLNDIETRFIYDTIAKEFPIFYYNEVSNISTPYAFLDTDIKQLKSIGVYHKISYKSNRIFTGTSNYISSLFNIVTGDFIDQNTLYAQCYKDFIEDTLIGKKLIHTIDLSLPNIQIQKFEDNQEIIIKETKYTILESDISLTNGKTKLTLLNK